eukprot:2821634-Alexandrium_andersonii.AAC.1
MCIRDRSCDATRGPARVAQGVPGAPLLDTPPVGVAEGPAVAPQPSSAQQSFGEVERPAIQSKRVAL